MAYVDGFILVVPKKNIAAYRRMASAAGKVWRKHGAIDYKECAGDDLDIKMVLTFPKLAKTKRGETVFFSWILYKSKAHRNQVNAKVMKDPAIVKMMKTKKPPFDMKRMAYGGFKVVVDEGR